MYYYYRVEVIQNQINKGSDKHMTIVVYVD